MTNTRPLLLVVCPTLPYPPESGGDIRLFYVLRGLAETFEIHVLSARKGQHEQLRVQSGVKAVHVAGRLDEHSLTGRLAEKVNFWRDMPHGMTFDIEPGLRTTLHKLVSTIRFDAVLIEHLYMMQYARFVEDAPIFYTAHNVESVKMSRWYGNEPCSWRRRLLRAAQAAVVRRMESGVGKTARAVFTTSDVDKQLLERMNRGGRFVVAPNGADTKYFRPTAFTGPAEPPVVLFVGTLSYKPNSEAARFLIDRIFPSVKRRFANAECHLVGKTSGEDYSSLHRPELGVRMIGYVDDIRPYFERAHVLVAPLFIGSGTRLKIIEAMASGVPVVSTAIGAEGLAYTDGKDIVIANSAPEIAEAVIALLEDRERAGRIGRAGRELAERLYSWDASVDVVRRELERAVNENPTRA